MTKLRPKRLQHSGFRPAAIRLQLLTLQVFATSASKLKDVAMFFLGSVSVAVPVQLYRHKINKNCGGKTKEINFNLVTIQNASHSNAKQYLT